MDPSDIHGAHLSFSNNFLDFIFVFDEPYLLCLPLGVPLLFVLAVFHLLSVV